MQYLGYVVIDARPEPRSWGLCWEPWQGAIVAPMIPAIERMAGLRRDYDGPSRFLCVLPRGHDKTGLIGRLANWVLAFSRRPIRGTAAAGDKDQAALLLDSMNAEIALNPWLAARLKSHNYAIRGPGGTLKVIAADAKTSSGLKSDFIVCDELTYWPRRDLFDVLLSGSEKRPHAVFVIITNAGIRDSWQHGILKAALADPAHWHVYQAPVDTQLATWMDAEKIRSLRGMLTRSHARRVFDNRWSERCDAPLLDWELLSGCHADCLWPAGPPPLETGDLFVGMDVGRTRDRSVITTLEQVEDVAWVREIKVLENAPFEQQAAEFRARLRPRVRAARIDQGSIGYGLAESLCAQYPRLVQGVAMGETWQGRSALQMHIAFQTHRIRIPNDPDLNADLQLVEEVGNSKAGLPVLHTPRNAAGHADRFWSLALALSAIPTVPRKSIVPPRGVRSSLAGK